MKNKKFRVASLFLFAAIIYAGCCCPPDNDPNPCSPQLVGSIVSRYVMFGNPDNDSLTQSMATHPGPGASTSPASSASSPSAATVPSSPAPTSAQGAVICSGTGLCQVQVFALTPAQSAAASQSIEVSFQLLTANEKKYKGQILAMKFSKQALIDKQPGQVKYFWNSTNTYKFDSDYSLDNPMFKDLNLPKNSKIKKTDICRVLPLHGDTVIVYAYFSHD